MNSLFLVLGFLVLVLNCLGHPLPSHHHGFGRTRVVYIAAVDLEWDYAPLGNIVNDDPIADNFIKQGPNRIGSRYSKVVYRRFSDGSFLHQIPSPRWAGIVGPLFRAEVGDTIKVVFANLAFKCNQPFTVHSHGVFYLKNSEGAMYEDKTSGGDKLDDAVKPGDVYTYEWEVKESFAPTPDDDNCLPWAYHSHRISTTDVETGLLGLFLTCKKGVLNSNGERLDVDREYVIYQDVTNEQDSWCINSSISNCGEPSTCAQLLGNGDSAFANSNKMHHMNGYVYGNLPGLEASVGERVVLHFFSLTEGIQSAHINGQTLLYKRQRLDAINFYPAYFRSAIMIPEHAGTWLLSSLITDRYTAGMQAYIHIKPRNSYNPGDLRGAFDIPADHSQTYYRKPVKTFYIAAEKVVWDYGPTGKNLYNGGLLTDPNSTSSTYFSRGDDRLGGRYVKALYIEYTDSTFTKKKTRTPEEVHLGFLGPVIKAEVGETVEIVFQNNADREYSIFVHGLTYPKEQEGFVVKDPFTGKFTGKVARPGEQVVYTYTVTDNASPTENDPPCLTYTYHSAVDFTKDIYTGLVGPLIVCKKGHKFDFSSQRSFGHWDRYGRFKERSFYLIFFTMNENNSWYIDENIQLFAGNPNSVDKTDSAFALSNIFFSINGLGYANLPGINMCVGDHVTWHIFGLGAFRDNHGANFHGQTLEFNGNKVEGKVIQPGIGVTLHSVPDEVGRWTLHCRTNFHFSNGMEALYNVFSCGSKYHQRWGNRPHRVRRYFIAAEEVIWDYAPVLIDPTTGLSLTNTSLIGYTYIKGGPNFIGSKYKKAVYREYTDATFTTRVTRGPDDIHLELLGPIIQAEVGEIVEVYFQNRASRSFSIHPQGVMYDKANEGAEYQDGSEFRDDNAVPPGESYIYRWEIPERSGPGKSDPNCISWMYHSSVEATKDILSGLVGPLIICRRGVLNAYGKRTDGVARQFVLMFQNLDENDSHYIQENAARFAPGRQNITDPDFAAANVKFSVNGRIYGNVRGLTMVEGETVAWHIQNLGSSLDAHPIHFHGQTFIHRTRRAHRKDVIETFPSVTETVEMFLDNPGTWLVHCHVSFHSKRGMEALYTIKPKPKQSYHNYFDNNALGFTLY